MSEEGITRRNFMIRTMVSIFAFIGAALAVPLGGFSIFPALKRRESGWSDAGTARDLRVNVPQERREAGDWNHSRLLSELSASGMRIPVACGNAAL